MKDQERVIAGGARVGAAARASRQHRTMAVMLFGAHLGLAGPAWAVEFDTGVQDLKLRWDNTVKYNASYRLKDPSATLTADTNLDDGDRNFRKGLVSNRFDLLSEVDARYRDVGVRLSGAAWYDTVYNRSNDNDSPLTANSQSVAYNEFTRATRNLHGRRAEVLDAFVFGKLDVAGAPLTVRLGRHTLIYGESLFFGSNGIANAQGPVDVVKLVTVPGSQFKEILRPVEQLSGVLQVTPRLTLGAYYQFRWRQSLIPGAGSYLSAADFVGDGAERFIVGAPITPGGGPAAFWRGDDLKGKNSGQGGFQLRWAPDGSEWEFGLYAARYHDKTPYLYLVPSAAPDVVTGQVGSIREVYHEGIRTFGASATTSIGQLNLAFEGSIRDNASLVSDPQVVSLGTSDNSGAPAYAVGKTGHVQASAIYVLTKTPLWDAGAFLGEVAWNRRLSIDKNPGALDPNTTRDAAALRFIFEPSYFQVVPGLNLSVPIGLGWNFMGRSSSIFNWNGGSSHGGDYSVGFNFTYQQVWQGGLSYTGFFGGADGFLTPANSPTPVLSYKQVYKDRNFISLTLKRAF
ncbi:DUF1302 domain-containing protein [Methylibium sp.]|uniref:DUF1302 domain-containing protein n=1 Tax=Methylibium sp. TaxID=2067992 RepID=UPI003D11DF6D